MSEQALGHNPGMSVSKFYEGKSVFITGCSGFLGSVLLEILLRCTGIKTAYILLRAKRGESPETRLTSVFEKKIFDRVKKTQPDVLHKVHMVAGDLSSPGLGLSDNDRLELIENVSVVFHCAACLNFRKDLRFLLTHNVLGTKYVLDLCKDMEKLETLIYTSTIACNCHLPKLKEQVYRMPITATRIVEVLEKEDDVALDKLVANIIGKWPNYYTFSKNVGENLVREHYSTVPTAIIRTSLIGPCWKGVRPGYVESSSGLFAFGSAMGKGFIRVVRCDPDLLIPNVPVDIAANTHIVAAWGLVTQKYSPFLVVNCVRDVEDTTFRLYSHEVRKMVKYHPMPRAFLPPSITLCKSAYSYWAYSLFEHYIPAIVVDAILLVTGNKPKMFNAYRFYDRAFALFTYFFFHPLTLDNSVFRTLRGKHDGEDKHTLKTSP